MQFVAHMSRTPDEDELWQNAKRFEGIENSLTIACFKNTETIFIWQMRNKEMQKMEYVWKNELNIKEAMVSVHNFTEGWVKNIWSLNKKIMLIFYIVNTWKKMNLFETTF